MKNTPLFAALLVASSLEAASLIPVVLEAENAALGSGLGTASEGSITYITATANGSGTLPASATSVGTLSASFAEAGNYHLYIKVYVGPQTFNDDSLFVATRFGDVAIDDATGWQMLNGLADSIGYSDPGSTVSSGGTVGSGAWKWMRVSQNPFTVPAGALNQTFLFASREDGLRIDKLAFGAEGVFFTVNQLDNGLPGSEEGNGGSGPLQTSGPVLASGKSKFLGSVWSTSASYNRDYDFYWNGMWLGNAGKWGSVEGTRDAMNFDVADQGYAFAQEHDIYYNFHVLVWGAQQPSWIESLPPDEQLAEIRQWFEAVKARYPDCDSVQVVNEPLHQPPDASHSGKYINALGGSGETGWDWIINAFELAREIFPGTPLMINEYSVENDLTAARDYVEIIELLKERGLIDVIGVQGHAFSTKNASVSTMQQCLDIIAETGLPIVVTEMEIDGLDDQVQLAEFQRVFPVFWEHPGVIGINISGHRIGNWRTDQGAYLENEDETPRPAFVWLRHYVQSYEDWLGFDVTDNWADTQGWLGGPVYVGYNPIVYSNGIWMHVAHETDSAAGVWTYIFDSAE